jgi:hypothetical protein
MAALGKLSSKPGNCRVLGIIFGEGVVKETNAVEKLITRCGPSATSMAGRL